MRDKARISGIQMPTPTLAEFWSSRLTGKCKARARTAVRHRRRRSASPIPHGSKNYTDGDVRYIPVA